MMMRFFYLLLLISFNICFGQKPTTLEKVFDKAEAYYKNEPYYSYTSVYNFYDNKLSKKIRESKIGLVLRKNKVSYQKLEGVEMIDFGDYNVIVNYPTKTFYLSSISQEDKKSPIALKSFLAMFDVKKLSEDSEYWICSLFAEKKRGSQFKELTIHISKKNYAIYKEVFVLQTSQLTKKAKMAKVDSKLEVIFSKNKQNPIQDDKLTNRNNYFNIKNKKITVSKKYSNFQLLTL